MTPLPISTANSKPILNSTSAPFRPKRRHRPRSSSGRNDHQFFHQHLNESYSSRSLVFSPFAWLKWQFLCHVGSTEVAGFGLSSPHQPLYLDDILLIKQSASFVTVAFDDHAIADLFDEMADRGIAPQRFARIWLHTHPGASVTPSGTDEETFTRCFGSCDWAVMAILGRTGRTYARLRFNAGPGAAVEIPTAVEWSLWPELASGESLTLQIAEWMKQYQTLVERNEYHFDFPFDRDWFHSQDEGWLSPLDPSSSLNPASPLNPTSTFNPSMTPQEELTPNLLPGSLDIVAGSDVTPFPHGTNHGFE